MPLTQPRVFLFTMGTCIWVLGALLAVVAGLGGLTLLLRPEALLNPRLISAIGLIAAACLWLGGRWRRRALAGPDGTPP